MKTISNKLNNFLEQYLPFIGLTIGMIVFFLIYGYEILNPTVIDWLMQGDPAQIFLGWHFFRSEPFSFPIGLMTTYVHPSSTSIIFTSSIPLLAIPLKIIAPYLPPIFQYLGIWLLLCYALQGLFAVFLLKRFTTKHLLVLLGVCFFLLSPVLAHRAQVHLALCAHWIILAALYLYLGNYTLSTKIRWIALLAIALMVHFYLFVMAGVIFAGFLSKPLLDNFRSNWFSVFTISIVSIATLLMLMWILGYFVIGIAGAPGPEFGKHSMNIISPVNPFIKPTDPALLINPNKISSFLEPLPLLDYQTHEAFNYFGLGLILLLSVALYYLLSQKQLSIKKQHIPLACISILLLLQALE